jgi:hypothetical protein
MLSRRGLHAVTLQPDLLPWHWLNSIGWYNREINFAVIDHSQSGAEFGFTAATLTRRFGVPAAIVSCGNSDIYVYNRPSDVQFRGYLYEAAIEELLRQPGRVVELDAAVLRGKVGAPDGASRTSAPGQKGYLVLSDWMPMDAGSYVLRYEYMADGVPAPGVMELSGHGATSEIELTNPLLFLPGSRRAVVYFGLDQPMPIQIQLYSNGNGRLTLRRLEFMRLR